MNYEQRRAVIECLNRAQLSSAKLVTVCLHVSGWTQEEIGEVLGLEQQTVSYHWTDALGKLAEAGEAFRRKLKDKRSI